MKKFKLFGLLFTVCATLLILGAFKSSAATVNNISLETRNDYIGSPVKCTVSATPSTNNTYKFVWALNDWKEWGVIQDFSSSNQATFNPKKPGSYQIYVDIKDADENKTTDFVTFNKYIGWSTEISVPENGVINTPSPLNAKITGTANYMDFQYKFVWSLNNWKEWGVIQDFSSSRTADFIPKKPGSYSIYIDAKDSNDNIITKSKTLNVSLGWSPELSTSVPLKRVGETVNLSASVLNPISDLSYQYKFVWSRDNWTEWGVIQDFSDSKTANFIPEKPGKYEIIVDVKDSFKNISSKSNFYTFSMGWSPTLKETAENNKIRTPIKLSADAPNSIPEDKLTYKFVWSKDNWKEWSVIQNFSSNKTVSYTPNSPGTYKFYVDIKDQYGNIYSKNVSKNIVLGWSYDLNVSLPNNKVGATATVKTNLNNTVAGNSFTYKFVWSRNNWKEWGVILGPSQYTSSCKFTAKKNGSYSIYVDIKDKYGNTVTKHYDYYINTEWSVWQPSISMTNNNPGYKMTVTANTSGKINGAKYKFVWSYNNWQEWGVMQNFSSSKTATFVPKKNGVYQIYTDVTDSTGSMNSSSANVTITSKEYKLVVNLNTQTVHALQKNWGGGYGASARNMPCSTGKQAGTTPTGTFPLKTKYRWHLLNGGVWGQWCSRIVGGVLFHSVPYSSSNNKALITKYYNQLGSPASAGCIRLRAVDAKWIHDNCKEGTPVEIGYFNPSNLPGKVYARRIKSSTTWDPTDPSLSSQYYDKGWQ